MYEYKHEDQEKTVDVVVCVMDEAASAQLVEWQAVWVDWPWIMPVTLSCDFAKHASQGLQ